MMGKLTLGLALAFSSAYAAQVQPGGLRPAIEKAMNAMAPDTYSLSQVLSNFKGLDSDKKGPALAALEETLKAKLPGGAFPADEAKQRELVAAAIQERCQKANEDATRLARKYPEAEDGRVRGPVPRQAEEDLLRSESLLRAEQIFLLDEAKGAVEKAGKAIKRILDQAEFDHAANLFKGEQAVDLLIGQLLLDPAVVEANKSLLSGNEFERTLRERLGPDGDYAVLEARVDPVGRIVSFGAPLSASPGQASVLLTVSHNGLINKEIKGIKPLPPTTQEALTRAVEEYNAAVSQRLRVHELSKLTFRSPFNKAHRDMLKAAYAASAEDLANFLALKGIKGNDTKNAELHVISSTDVEGPVIYSGYIEQEKAKHWFTFRIEDGRRLSMEWKSDKGPPGSSGRIWKAPPP